jgi:hypothetical protein
VLQHVRAQENVHGAIGVDRHVAQVNAGIVHVLRSRSAVRYSRNGSARSGGESRADGAKSMKRKRRERSSSPSRCCKYRKYSRSRSVAPQIGQVYASQFWVSTAVRAWTHW